MANTTVAVDCMSGDHGAHEALKACQSFIDQQPSAKLILVGQADVLASFSHPRVEIVEASEIVTMEDSLEVALRRKKQSSMRIAIEQVKLGKAQVALSAGNTGALMALSRYLLKTIPGIDRPAISFPLPNISGGYTTMLDLGANVDCTAQHLLQFAVLGSALDAVTKNISNPSVGLLNIGEEDIKGNEVVKEAAALLRKAHQANLLNFYGNVEGDDTFRATTDVVVCDGFVGNVALKTVEGIAWMMSTSLKQEFKRNWLTKLSALVAYPVLNSFKKRFEPRSYNGAALLGLRGLVYKSHGSADAFAFEKALGRAYQAADKQLLQQIMLKVEQINALISQQP